MAKKKAATNVYLNTYADGTREEVEAGSLDEARNRARRDCGAHLSTEEVAVAPTEADAE